MVGLRLGTATTSNCAYAANNDLLNLAYGYGTTNNNGNLQSQTIRTSGDATLNVTQSYQYDRMNRLTKFTEGGQSHDYGYDQWGNRWVSAHDSGLPWSVLTPVTNVFNPATNRINDLAYDAAGNRTTVAPFTLAYDGENRLTSAASGNGSASYAYDGEGRRVKKLTCPGTQPCTDSTTGVVKRVYVYDVSGQLAAEYSTQPNPVAGRQ